jgi:tRNA(Arg) A34 adenosine deaminase TadA
MKRTLLREALRLAAAKNTPEGHPSFFTKSRHFSFVVQNSKIVEYGVNRNVDPRVSFGYAPTMGQHSEYVALRKAKGILDFDARWEMLNIALNRRGEVRLSKPCPCCVNLLRYVGCWSVTFSTETGFAELKLREPRKG